MHGSLVELIFDVQLHKAHTRADQCSERSKISLLSCNMERSVVAGIWSGTEPRSCGVLDNGLCINACVCVCCEVGM